jgi:hypothetical protein
VNSKADEQKSRRGEKYADEHIEEQSSNTTKNQTLILVSLTRKLLTVEKSLQRCDQTKLS